MAFIACTGVNAAFGAGHETSSVRVERPDVCCAVDVSQLFVGQKSQVDTCAGDFFRILLAQEYRVCESAEDEVLVAQSCADIVRVGVVKRCSEIVCELDCDGACASELLFVPMVNLGVSHENVGNSWEIIAEDSVGFVESCPL